MASKLNSRSNNLNNDKSGQHHIIINPFAFHLKKDARFLTFLESPAFISGKKNKLKSSDTVQVLMTYLMRSFLSWFSDINSFISCSSNLFSVKLLCDDIAEVF